MDTEKNNYNIVTHLLKAKARCNKGVSMIAEISQNNEATPGNNMFCWSVTTTMSHCNTAAARKGVFFGHPVTISLGSMRQVSQSRLLNRGS
jgi:hypothetical protein